MIGFTFGGVFGAGVLAATTSDDPLGIILGTGVAGAVLVLFIFGLIVPKAAVTQRDEEIHRLQTLIDDEVLPMVKTYAETMSRNTDAIEQSTEALRVLADIQRAKELRP